MVDVGARLRHVERQTRTMQRDVIAAATRDGSLPDLFWFIEMRLPLRLRQQFGVHVYPMCAPVGWIPVIPAHPDPWAAYEFADLLLALVERDNVGSGIEFSICLTSREALGDIAYYVWGDPRTTPTAEVQDTICPHCGGVNGCACPPAPAYICVEDTATLTCTIHPVEALPATLTPKTARVRWFVIPDSSMRRSLHLLSAEDSNGKGLSESNRTKPLESCGKLIPERIFAPSDMPVGISGLD